MASDKYLTLSTQALRLAIERCTSYRPHVAYLGNDANGASAYAVQSESGKGGHRSFTVKLLKNSMGAKLGHCDCPNFTLGTRVSHTHGYCKHIAAACALHVARKQAQAAVLNAR